MSRSDTISPPTRLAEMLAPFIAVILAMISVTAGASYGKGLFPIVGPAGTTCLRIGVAALLLSVALRVWRVRFSRRSLQSGLIYGASMAGMNLLFYMAIARIPLGVALAIEFTGPLTVAALSSRQKSHFLLIGVALCGLLPLLPLQAKSSYDPWGLLMALGAGVGWAIYIWAGRWAGADHGARAPAVGMIIAAILILPVGIAGAGTKLLSLDLLAPALGVAVLSSAIPFTLEMFALRRLPTRSFGILTSCEPAVGAVIGFLMLGESLPLLKWGGIALVVLASLGTTLTGRADVKPQAEEAAAL